jgi:hypothetical protein
MDYVYQLHVEDPDKDPLDLFIISSPDGMTVDGKRQIRWSPDKIGDFAVVVMMRDPHGASYSQLWTITVLEMPDISVSITSPKNLATIWGTVRIGGTADISYGVLSGVEVKVGDSDWMVANGTLAWYLDLDVTELPEGKATISVRATDGNVYSEPAEVLVGIERPEVKDDGGRVKKVTEDVKDRDIDLTCLGLIILVLFGAVILFVWRRMTKDPPRYRAPFKEDGEEVEPLEDEEKRDEDEEEGKEDEAEVEEEENVEEEDEGEEYEYVCPTCDATVGSATECLACGTEFEDDEEEDIDNPFEDDDGETRG